MLFGRDTKYDAGVLTYALIYLLGEIPGFDYNQHLINDYGDRAVDTLLESIEARVSGWKNIVYMAIAYDWANERITTEQKQTIVEWFVSKCGDTPKLSEVRGYRFPRTPNSLYPGMAFYGDGINDNQAQIYVDFIPLFWMRQELSLMNREKMVAMLPVLLMQRTFMQQVITKLKIFMS